MIKGGDSGLNLSLTDLFGREIELPGLRSLVLSLITNRPIVVKVKGFPVTLVKRLEQIQAGFDQMVKKEIEDAKRRLQ